MQTNKKVAFFFKNSQARSDGSKGKYNANNNPVCANCKLSGLKCRRLQHILQISIKK